MSYNDYPRDFLDKLLLKKVREVYSKIELLDWSENIIQEIQGDLIDGSLSVDGSSTIRRTCSLSLRLKDNNYNIASIKNTVSLNKKVRIYVGIKNDLYDYSNFGTVVWFPLGVFVLTESNISHTIESYALSISGQDKMCLLNGTVGGVFTSVTNLYQEYVTDINGNVTTNDLLIYDIIKYLVIGLGEEDPSKVIINDVPLTIETPLKYIGAEIKYFNGDNEVSPDSEYITRTLNPGDFAGYELIDFTYPTELIKNAGDVITSALDNIVGVLGNYEYYYDIEGRFIFQEKKNYINTTFTPLTELSNGEYIADFRQLPYIYDFNNKNIVSSFSNTPDWLNIKNDFVVWGTQQDGGLIQYHLVIDDKPFVPSEYEKPWQQFLIDYGDNNINDPGKYYSELKAKLPQVYNSETNSWGSDPSSYNYYFDMIDSNTALGAYSVKAIGRRPVVINDENVSRLYPQEIPDIIILPTGVDINEINYLNSIGKRFQIVESNEYSNLYTRGCIGKDAFTVIRDMVYSHVSFNEVITIQSLPLYYLEPNRRINVEDEKSNIHGSYMITSMSIPLNVEGVMSINAIRVTSRI